MDHQIEAFVINRLRNLIPDANVIAEESGDLGSQSEYCFIIDPLDGTRNFSHRIVPFCIGIALAHKGKPVIASVIEPLSGDVYHALHGKGCFLNKRKTHVSSTQTLSRSLVDISRHLVFPRNAPLPKKRTFGSTILAHAYVASGKLDGQICTQATPWDCAAGSLLVTEAGGKVTNAKGKPWTLLDTVCVASNRKLHTPLLKLLPKRL